MSLPSLPTILLSRLGAGSCAVGGMAPGRCVDVPNFPMDCTSSFARPVFAELTPASICPMSPSIVTAPSALVPALIAPMAARPSPGGIPLPGSIADVMVNDTPATTLFKVPFTIFTGTLPRSMS